MSKSETCLDSIAHKKLHQDFMFTLKKQLRFPMLISTLPGPIEHACCAKECEDHTNVLVH